MATGQIHLVTIRCYTFNQSAFITNAMNGFVLQQTSFPYVALIVDDASTDNEQTVIKDYFYKNFDTLDTSIAYQDDLEYGTIYYARHKTNSNCYFAILLLKENHHRQRKSKMQYLASWMANTKYIAICEGDDYWTDPHKLQKQVVFLDEHIDYGLCYTDFDLYDQNSKQFSHAVFESGIYKRPSSFEDHLVNCGYIAPMSWVYRKSVYEQLEYRVYTDGSFSMALAFLKQSKVYYLPEVTCVYRAHKGSASRPSSLKKYFKQYKGVFDTQLFFADKYHVEERIVKLIKSGSYIKLLPSAIQSKQDEFIAEAAIFFKENNFNYDELYKLCNAYLQAHSDARKARKSHPYKIGKAILKPFSFIKRVKHSTK